MHYRRVTFTLDVPDPVRAKALAAGADAWLAGLPGLIAALSREWSITVGRAYRDASEAYVAEATRADGEPAVLKLCIPRPGDYARHEITALRLAGGSGLVPLLKSDTKRGALLVPRLGPSMADRRLPYARRLPILTGLARRVWRPAAGYGLPTGAEKGRWLIDFITRTWEELGRPCAERTVAHAVACAERRIGAHDDERAVLVHGDIHQWNALSGPYGPDGPEGPEGGYALVDPDGLLAEPEYDLGVLMREDPHELMAGDPWDRAHELAAATGTDPEAIWEWGVAERVSTGLLLTAIDLQPVGREMLAAADRISGLGGLEGSGV